MRITGEWVVEKDDELLGPSPSLLLLFPLPLAPPPPYRPAPSCTGTARR
jgi:hypothetical protein